MLKERKEMQVSEGARERERGSKTGETEREGEVHLGRGRMRWIRKEG